ncbi:MAG: myxococcus cysteine-rich repeat containing protein [Candidatus Gracilibacteria bacterium]|nr:myxococcus cysteine-rich repeat containing protein [Candidatus Gracilibacteria bacterium]
MYKKILISSAVFLIIIISNGTNKFLVTQAIPLSDQCGNGTREGLEQCDDSNTINGDGCSSSCRIEISCSDPIMHAIDDNGSDDSMYITFNSSNSSIKEINEVKNADIEAMDHHPGTGVLYAFTGEEDDDEDEKLLVIIDPTKGIPDPIKGVKVSEPPKEDDDWEVQGASFNPITQVLWLAMDEIGLTTVDLDTGATSLQKSLKKDPEGIAWNSNGTLLYMEYDDDIYTYNPSTDALKKVCNNVSGIESMEFDPNENLVIGFNNANKASNVSIFDLNTCKRASEYVYDIPNPYDDIETLSFACPAS